MNYIAIIEGTEIQLDEKIALDDSSLKTAFSVYLPEYANADIKRETTDNTVFIHLVKKAGCKGNLIDELKNCISEVNPALELGWQLKTGEINLQQLIAIQSDIDKAVETGQRWVTCAERVIQRLKEQSATTSHYPVL